MQTFLISPSLSETAIILDNKRLGKQRVECLQILNALLDKNYGWQNHPAIKMWRGYEMALWHYASYIILAWKSKGYKDTCQEKLNKLILATGKSFSHYDLPEWFNNPDFFAAHRSNLLRKNPEYYSQFGWTESNDLPYIWKS